jgi:predicted nuclease with TOPRIM domain
VNRGNKTDGVGKKAATITKKQSNINKLNKTDELITTRHQNNKSKLSRYYTNVRSLGNKFEELEMIDELEKPHIIRVTESWEKNTAADAEISLKGYTMYRKDRDDGRQGGGVLMYIDNKLNVVVREELKNDKFKESMW